MSGSNIPVGFNDDGERDPMGLGHNMIEDEDVEEMPPEHTCECGNYKNTNRKMCDQCLHVNQ